MQRSISNSNQPITKSLKSMFLKNKIFSFALLLLASFALLSFDMLSQWKEIKSYNGRFSVLLPDGDFTEKVIPIPSAIGAMEQHTFYFTPPKLDAENRFYQVTYLDYPEGTFHPDSTELREIFYQTSMEGAAQSVQGKLMYSEDVNARSYLTNTDNQEIKGKIWRIDYNKGNSIMKSKAFLVGDRFYTISVAMIKARSRNLDAQKYLDSFKLF
jgi:hypothetical protein